MDNTQKMGFGSVNDQDKSLQSRSGGFKFGLNTGNITVFEYNPNAGKDGAASDAIDVTFISGESETRSRFYDITRVYDGDNNLLTDENDPKYIKGYNDSMIQLQAAVTHITKALGVTQGQIDNALSTGVASFADWAKIMTTLVGPNFKEKSVDVFMQYQWNIPKGQTKTFLELPKNMKGGYFMVGHIIPVGKWNEQKSWIEKNDKGVEIPMEGLRYIDDAGNIHPFVRNEGFMKSRKGYQQNENDSAEQATMNTSNSVKEANW